MQERRFYPNTNQRQGPLEARRRLRAIKQQSSPRGEMSLTHKRLLWALTLEIDKRPDLDSHGRESNPSVREVVYPESLVAALTLEVCFR